jgi:hypothetical protein
MTVARLAISLDAGLARAMRKAAKDEPISAWLADAVRRKLRAEGLLRVVEDWEAEHGELTAAELRAATKRRPPRKRK